MAEHGERTSVVEKQGGLPRVGKGIKKLGGHDVLRGFQKLSSNLFTQVLTPEGKIGVAKIGFSNPEDLRNFVHEAGMNRRAKEAWRYGNVNAIPAVYDQFTVYLPDEAGKRQEHPVIITEYVPSKQNLFTFLEKNGRLDVRSTIKRLYPFALGVDALKQAGIVHRDIKPENVFMHNGFGRLADFGLAVDEGYKEEGEFVFGTTRYISPEHWRKEPLTNKTNVWGMGAVAYFAITGEHLMERNVAKDPDIIYKKETYDKYIEERLNNLPPTYRSTFAKVIAFDPDDRYDSCTEFMLALDKAEERRQQGPKHRGPWKDLPPTRMRPPKHRKPEERFI